MKHYLVFPFTWFAILISGIGAHAQDHSERLQALLKGSTGKTIEQVFHEIDDVLDTVPYNRAAAYEDELLHTAATLPHRREAFGWMYELTKLTYNKSGHEDNLFLYLLAIANDPAFENMAIQSKIQYEIGYSYYNIGDYGKAQLTLEKFLHSYQGPVNRDLINGLTMMGLILQDRNNFKEAGKFLNQALEKAVSVKDTAWIGLASGNLGSLYVDMGQLDRAVVFLHRDIQFGLKERLYESVANDFIELSYIAMEKGRLTQAKVALDSTLIMLRRDKRPFRRSWADAYQHLARYYRSTGRADSAYHFLEISQRIRDSLQNHRNESLLALRVNAFSQKKAEQDELVLKANLESNRLNRLFAASAGIGIVVVLIFSLLYIRQKKRINRILREKAMLTEAEMAVAKEQRKKEEAANQAKNKLFSIIAHDLRGPIGSLAMTLGMLHEDEINEKEFRPMLPDLKSQVENLYETTDNLLKWAYAQMDGTASKQELVDLAIVIDHVFALLKDYAARKNIRLVKLKAVNELVITADADQIEIVVRNLTSNAIKFSPLGSTVSLECLVIDEMAVIRVRDQGKGLPDAVIQNVQQGTFSQPSFGTAGEKGTGLGLVMCKEFIAANNGRLKIAQNKPSGTIFRAAFLLSNRKE